MWQCKRVAVIGAGAMGTSLAAMLGRVVPVVVVCRNADRAAQLIRDGARTTGLVEASAQPIVVRSLDDLVSIGGASALFVTTKTTAIPDVVEQLKPRLGKIADQEAGCYVVSYQNGIEPGKQLMEMLGDGMGGVEGLGGVVRMVLTFGAIMDRERGLVDVTLCKGPQAIGSPSAAHGGVCETLAGVLSKGGLETVHDEEIEIRVWEKALVNAATNPVAALVNASVGQVMASPSREIVERLLDQGIEVARAAGVELADGYKDAAIRLLEQAGAHVPSMVDDIRGGRETEVGQLNRQIIEYGDRLGVSTQTHRVICSLIDTFDWKVYEKQRH